MDFPLLQKVWTPKGTTIHVNLLLCIMWSVDVKQNNDHSLLSNERRLITRLNLYPDLDPKKCNHG